MKLGNFLAPKKKANLGMQLATKFADAYENNHILENVVFYETRDGKSMTDSPYAIFKYLISNKEYNHLTHIWSVDSEAGDWDKIRNDYQQFENIKFVERNSDDYLYYLSSSHYLFNNSTFQSYFVPKKEQLCINTWHGIPLKKMGYDIHTGNPAGLQNVVRNFFFSDILISPNQHTSNMFSESFKLSGAFDGKIAEIGYPRMDLTDDVNRQSVIEKLLLEDIDLDQSKKNILYCPTWKGSDVNKAKNELSQIIAESSLLRNKLSSQYNVLVKVHPFIYDSAKNQEKLKPYLVPDFVNPNEVMSGIDLLITDYSSIFFDFLKTNRPIIFYCWDKEVYSGDRGLYISEENLPGPVASRVEQVVKYVKDIEQISDTYKEKYKKNREQYLPYEDGKSTKRVVEYVFDKKQPDIGNVLRCKDNNKTSILIYLGGMKNNGITSSVLNLLKNLDYEKYDVTCFSGYPRSKEAINNILSIPKEARLIYKPGYTILDSSEQINLAKFNKQISQKSAKAIPWHGVEREANRIFSNRTFDVAIDFSGYSFYWSKYILGADAKRKICFLHSDMVADKDKEVNGVKIHEKNLMALFWNYSKFDELITVSPVMKKINQENLKNYVSPNKISFSLNTLDIEKLSGSNVRVENTDSKFKPVNIELTSEQSCLQISDDWDSKESVDYDINDNDRIRAIVSVQLGNKCKYKVLINDIYVGWIDSTAVAERQYAIKTKTQVALHGYITGKNGYYIWMDVPNFKEARKVCKVNEYEYLLIDIKMIAELENGKVYYYISNSGMDLGWVNQSAITEVKNNLILRKLKNAYSNRNKQADAENRIKETITENGFLKITSFPKGDIWNKSILLKKEKEVIKGYLNQNLRYTLKVFTQDGWYYRVWEKESFVGWVSERNVELLTDQQIIYSESLDVRITLNDSVIYNDIYSQSPIVAEKKSYEVISKLTTVNGIYYETSDSYFISPEFVEEMTEKSQRDIKGKLIEINENNYNLVTMGRLSPEKRQKELIEAFSMLQDKYKNLRLFIMGDGPLRKDLEQLITKLKLTNRVFLLGHQDKPFELLKKCQLFILNSAYEGQPMVLLEAMALGVPVAATKIPAIEYVLQGGKAGLLADDNSVSGIAKLIEKAYIDKLPATDFDVVEYNKKAVEMFYEVIEGKFF